MILSSLGSATLPVPHNGSECRFEPRYVMVVSRGDDDQQRDTTGVDQVHWLAPLFSPDSCWLVTRICGQREPSRVFRPRHFSATQCLPCHRIRVARRTVRQIGSWRAPIPELYGRARPHYRSAFRAAPSTGSLRGAGAGPLRMLSELRWFCARLRAGAGKCWRMGLSQRVGRRGTSSFTLCRNASETSQGNRSAFTNRVLRDA